MQRIIYDMHNEKCVFTERERNKDIISAYNTINGYFMRLLAAKNYNFSYYSNVHVGLDYGFNVNFSTRDNGEIEYSWDTWYDKLIKKDYRRHIAIQFDTPEEAIKDFEAVYLPILEAEEIIEKGAKIEVSNDC